MKFWLSKLSDTEDISVKATKQEVRAYQANIALTHRYTQDSSLRMCKTFCAIWPLGGDEINKQNS